MKTTRGLLAVLFVAVAVMNASAQFRLSINNETGIFEKGENAVITLTPDSGLVDTLQIRIYRNNQVVERHKLLPDAPVNIVNGRFRETCAIFVEVQQGRDTQGIGFVVAPGGFEPGYEEPDDLMEYWYEQKREQSALPMNAKLVPLQVPAQDRGKYVCYDLELSAMGPRPARGYFAKPVGAKKGSLPIVILCRAAGVAGDWCRCQVGECVGNAKKGTKGALSLDLNAHGMLNGQPDEYYTDLENGLLKDYSNQGVQSRESYYFYGMYMRLLRAIEFMTQQPEWDGKRILVIGESQGGGQAAVAAGLDSRVSAVVLNVPAMFDFGAPKDGRRAGWPQPYENNRNMGTRLDSVLPYFDASLLIRHSKADVICEIGLIDMTCPASAIFAGLNGMDGEKIINTVPYRAHQWPSGEIRSEWEKKYLQQRLDFIDNYLK